MNQTLHKLGFSEQDKVLIIHADDAGLSCAENRATIKALEAGVVNSYSIMVPCPWFYDMAAFAKENPQYDAGIHLTLTSEWKYYKFRPILPKHEVPSLVDQHGFFHSSCALVQQYANPEEVMKELRAQINTAFTFGIAPTHLDSHMFSLDISQELLMVYQALGREFKLPILLNQEVLTEFGVDTEERDRCVDQVYVGDYSWFEGPGLARYYDQVIDHVTAGLHIILIHPAYNDSEMQNICIEHPNFGAAWRQKDFDYFTSPSCSQKLKESNIQLITWRQIQQLL